jgi:nucleotide-binding universal stress UspA family protein
MVSWLKIVCAVDFTETSRSALEHAADLARRFDAELTLVHVWKGPGAVGGRALAAPAAMEQQTAELGRKLEGWKREAERLAGRQVGTTIATGSPAAEVARFAADEKADLVVVGTRGRTGIERAVLGSVAEGIVRHAPCAVLVARPAQEWGD